MKNALMMMATALLMMSCAPQRSHSTVNKSGEKAHKRSQQALGRMYGRNYNTPNRFRSKHF